MLCYETAKQECVSPAAHSPYSQRVSAPFQLCGASHLPWSVLPAQRQPCRGWGHWDHRGQPVRDYHLWHDRDCPLKTVSLRSVLKEALDSVSLYVTRGMKQISKAILEVRNTHFSLKYHELLYIKWKDLSFGSIRVTHLEWTSQSIRMLAGLWYKHSEDRHASIFWWRLASTVLTHSRDTGQEPTTGREEELRLKALLSCKHPTCVLKGRASPPCRPGSVIGVPQLEGGSEEGPGGESGTDRNLQVLYVFS